MSEETLFKTKEEKIEAVTNIVKDILSSGNVSITVEEYRCLDKDGNITKVSQFVTLTAEKSFGAETQ